jgi:pyruvate dehydrogenase phosphatase
MAYRKICLPTSQKDASSQSCSNIRFIVLATDGLWDELSSEEVVSLVGGHLSGLKGTVSKTDLPNLVPTSAGSPTVEGKNKKTGSKERSSWAFIDDNVSTHLIRNAFGGGNESELRKRLSIPAPYSRRFRDDVTVTVVWWEEDHTLEQKLQAKL